MDNITVLDGPELLRFIQELTADKRIVHTLRIHQREGGVAYKVNSGTWSPTIGRRADAGGY